MIKINSSANCKLPPAIYSISEQEFLRVGHEPYGDGGCCVRQQWWRAHSGHTPDDYTGAQLDWAGCPQCWGISNELNKVVRGMRGRVARGNHGGAHSAHVLRPLIEWHAERESGLVAAGME
jgi:hypothetical protein